MPGHAPPVTDERSALAAFLHQQQDAFRIVVHGLTDEQAGLCPTPSALSLGALVKHVTDVQEGWLADVLAAPGRRAADTDAEQAAYQAALTWQEGDTLTAALAAFDDVCARVQAAVATRDLDTPVPIPPAPWNPTDIDSWSVRWVWFHLIEELARHAGHADIIREAVDGGTLWQLMAQREGWPQAW